MSTKAKKEGKNSVFSLFPYPLFFLKTFNNNILRNLFIIFFFAFFVFTPYLKAGEATIDLNVSLNSQGGNKVEADYPFLNLITISNTNSSGDTLDAKGSKINYTLPSGSNYVSFTGDGWRNCTLDSSIVTCDYNSSLTNGKTSSTLYLKIKAPSSTGTITPKVNVSPALGVNDPNDKNDDANMTLEVGKSNLQASKTSSKKTLQVNEQFAYTITISNPNNESSPTVKARNVTISDTLPSQISFVSLDDTSWCSQNSGTITCSGTDLDVDTNRSVTITAKASSGGTDINNTATIHTDSSDYNGNTEKPSAIVDVDLADIELTQNLIGGIDSSNAAINSNVTYRLHVVNNGASPAENVKLSDKLPSGVSFVSYDDTNWTCDGTSTINCTLKDTNLIHGKSYDLNLLVTMPATHGDIINDANISTTSTESDTSNNKKSLTTHVKSADLDISKTPDGGTADIGTEYTYTIKVTNNGLATAHNVEVNDTLDSKMSDGSASISCGSSLQNCNLGDIDANSSKSFTVTVKMPTDSLGDVTNTANVTTDTDQENLKNTSDTATTHIKGPNLNITKDANVTEVGLGKAFSYTINVVNVSSAAAKDVNITDQLPSDVNITNIDSPNGWTCPTSFPITGTFHCTKDTFDGNSSSSIIFEAQAPSSIQSAVVKKVNKVKISHSLSSNDGNASATVNVKGVTLDIKKLASSTAVVGGLIDYNITVKNTSPSDAQDLTLSDNLSKLGSGYTINSIKDSGNWNCSGVGTSTLNCSRATLLAGVKSSPIHFDVNVPSNANLGKVTNTASVTTTTSPTPDVNDSASTTIKGADIVVIPPTTTTAVANKNVVFTIGVKNQGIATAKDVNITNHFNTNASAYFTDIKIDCNGSTNYVSVNNNECQLGDITKDQTKNITISATAPNYIGKVINGSVAVTSTPQLAKDQTNDNKDWEVTIKGADLSITKTVSPNPAKLNEPVTYTITVVNNGLADANNTYVDDTLLNGFTNILTTGCTNNGSSVSGQAVHCTLGTLAKNASKFFTITTNAPNKDGAYLNTATTSSDTSEENTTDNNASVNLDVQGADLVMHKSDSADPVATNSTYYYSLRVTNEGNSSAYGAEINDTIPSSGYRFTYVGPLDVQNSDWDCSKTGNLIHCNTKVTNFEMPHGYDSGTILRYKVKAPSTIGTVHNTAIVDSNTSEAQPNNNTDTEPTKVINIDLQAKKEINGANYGANENYVAIGGTLKYDIYVRNAPISGITPPGITDVNVTDVLPDNIANISVTPSARFTCNSPTTAGATLFCTMNDGVNTPLTVANGWVLVATVNSKAFNASTFNENNESKNFIVNKYKAETSFGDQDPTNNAPTTVYGYLRTNTLVRGANMSIVKTVSKNPVGANQLFSYNLAVKNWPEKSTGEHDNPSTIADNIVVKDKLPTDVNFTSASGTDWDCNESSHILTCAYKNTIAPSNSAPDITVNVIAPNSTGEVLTNEANVTNSTKELTRLLPDNTDEVNTTTQGAKIVFKSIAQTPNPVGAYGTHSYNIIIKNAGLASAHDINVTFNFNNMSSNPGWMDVNGTGTNWNCDAYDTINSKLICHLPTLLSGSNSNVLTISSIAPNHNGSITNSVSVIGIDNTNTTTGQSKDINTTIKGSDLQITKSAHDPDTHSDDSYHNDNISIGIGKTIDFKLSVKNINLGLAKDIMVTDKMPSGFSDFNITNQGDWNCSFASNKLTCTRSKLAPKTTANDILVSAKTSPKIDDVVNTADVNTSTVEVNKNNNSDDVNIKLEGATLNANLDVSKTQVALGGDFTYILDINNTGKNQAMNVNTTDKLPADFTFVDNNGSDSDWNCTQVGNMVSCTQPLIEAYNSESILRLNIKAPTDKIGTYPNSIDINSSSIQTAIHKTAPKVRVIGADLNVSISATPTDVLEDRNVTYTMNIKDMNISTAHDVVLKQTFSKPINALYITSGASDCNLTDSNQSVTCNYPTLDYNQDKNITVVATMPNTNTLINPLKSTVAVTTPTPQEDLANHTASVDAKVHPIIPVADYRFEECKWDGTSHDVIDSINGLNGEAKHGAQTINHYLAYDDNNFSTAWRSGKFNGSDDYIYIHDNQKLHITGDQTMCAWVKPSKFSKRRNIIAKAYGGEGTITQETDGGLTYYYGTNGDNGSPYQGFGSSQALTLNKWSHICIVRDLKKMKLKWYINDTKTHEGNAHYSQATAGTNPLKIAAGYVHKFKGLIDEVEIYNIALDDRAIHNIYNYEKNHKNYDGTDRNETICGVDLQVVKTANPSGDVGAESNLAYNITVKNLSSEPVTKGFTLSDSLPADVSYGGDTHSSNLSCAGTNDMNCTFPAGLIMNKNGSETITINTKTANVDKVDINNTATVTAVQPDSNLSNNSDSASNKIIGTDLYITKTATPAEPNPGSAFIYTVTVKNISSLADARNLVITDHYDDKLLYSNISTSTNEANATISCSTLSNHRVSCSVNKLSKGNIVQLFLSMVSPNAAKGLINEANVTSETKDTNLSNNSIKIFTDTNNSVSGSSIFRPSLKLFNNDVSANKYGNIATIGNTMLVPNNYTGTQKLNEINSSLLSSSSAQLNLIDTNNSNPDDNITIEYAGLYWGGHLHGDDKNETGNNIPFNTVTFITPDHIAHTITVAKTDSNGTVNLSNRADFYHFKKGDKNNDTSNIGNYRIFYGAKADITNIIRDLNSSQLNGNYTVANMSVTSGIDKYDWAPSIETDSNTTTPSWTRFRNYGYFGGWSMVVVYSINHRYHRGVRFKNLSTFSGFVDLTPPGPNGQAKLPIDVKGFITPIHGDIESSLYSFVQGGDRQLSLEDMTVKDKAGKENRVIEDTNNTTNIFNDTITLKDASGNPISKNPDEDYNVGNDIDQYNLNSKYNDNGNCINDDGRPCYLSNSQDDTNVTISVKESDKLDGTEYPSEQAFVQMLSMQTQIFTPDFIDSYKECFKLKSPLSPQLGWVPCSDSNSSSALRRGDTVRYRLTVINTGDDYANDVYILDNLPREVNYEENSSIVTHILPFDELESGSPCSSSDYEYNETIRDECSEHLKDLIENNATSPLTTITTIDSNGTDNIDHNYDGFTPPSDGNNSLIYKFDKFPKDSVTWIEFNATINGYAALGHTFMNKMSITFTNPTLADYNLSGGTVTQVSLPVESSPVTFNWDNIKVTAVDVGRKSVGAKVVNAPFDLNVTLTGMSGLDKGDANTSIFLNSLRIIDAYNNTSKDIYPTVVDSNTGIPLSTGSYTWLTHGTSYNLASKRLGFDMNITVKSSDGNYSVSKRYPQDFPKVYNASTPYTGDLFSTRPRNFNLVLSGANTTPFTGGIIVKSGKAFTINVGTPDINGSNSQDYNASLIKSATGVAGSDGISIIPTINGCASQGDLNISALDFNKSGVALTNSLKYGNVGIVKIALRDSNWTAIDNNLNHDCNTTTIGDNNTSDADGIISCSIDGHSTSIVFEPDHFDFAHTNITDHHNGFTYMVNNPISDSMYAKISTTVEAKNAEDNTTSFFSDTCYANDVNISLSYNAQSKDLNDLNISVANENNLTNISSDFNISATNNIATTTTHGDNFTAGTSPTLLRMGIDRNTTGFALQPALIDAQNLQGSISGYLGITDANVSVGLGTNISTTTNLHFLFGRVHAPDYRFPGKTGKAKIYYEAYCKDCNQTYRSNMNISNKESIDSIDWYMNTRHTSLSDGNVSLYKPAKDTNLSTYSSAAITSGAETITATAPTTPYIDKVDINATDWLTYDPKDFILEFQKDMEDWAGQGKLGHTIDTNVSVRSNRRLNW